jgi:DNA-binding NtrC family response regulator
MPDRLSIQSAAAGPATVLVVDADGPARGQMAEWLRGAGYATLEAAAFDQARRLLAAGPPDVLVVGLRLGAFNGLHLVITARAVHPALRAVLTTSAEDAALEREARQADAAYVVKPILRDALLAAVAHGHGGLPDSEPGCDGCTPSPMRE